VENIAAFLYNNAFSYQKMGYAATIGVALALIIAIVVVIQRRVIGKAEAL
jgi:multiple sugar transport system permease protein